MANITRTTSKNGAIGVALLALSGSLLAVDVGSTHALQAEQTAFAPAEAAPIATVAAIAAFPPRVACALPAIHQRAAVVAHRAAAPHRSLPQLTFAALIVRHVDRRNDHPAAPSQRLRGASPAVAHDAIRAPQPAPVVRSVALVAAPRAQIHPQSHAAPHTVAHASNGPRAAGRSAVEAAQYFAVRTVEAQNPGLEHVAAVTRKRGSSRLVVHIIAKTHVGTLVEYEVLRRNGIGFAIESRTSRFVALSPRTKAASRTSPAGQT